MIIFLYGPDSYSSQQKLNEIIEYYQKVHPRGLNLKCFDDQKLDYQEFKKELQITPMFKEKKLIILKNVFSNQEFKNSFLKDSLSSFSKEEGVILFYQKGEIAKNDPLFIFLERKAKIQKFPLLQGEKLKSWLKKEFKKYQIEAEGKVIDKLISYLGNDLWSLAQEIKKLATFKKNKEIQVRDVELLVRPKIETDIFKTIEAIASKNKRQALSLIHQHLEKGESPLYLLHMINFQFRNLLIVRDLIEKGNSYYLIAQKTLFRPYLLKKSYWQAQKFTLEDLKKIYQKIFQVDFDIKTGKIEAEMALDLLIAEI